MHRFEQLRVLTLSLACSLTALAGTVAPTPASAAGRSILVVGPHEDDETLLGAGRTRDAVLAGDTVHIVLVTNGDINGTTEGLLRERESVAAAALLGVPEQNVVFLGYGDQLLYNLWSATSGTRVFTSVAGQTATYGNRGLGGMDFHRFLTGAAGPYTRDTILGDFKALITTFQPDEIYTVSRFDNHGDHDSTAKFFNEALIALKREGVDIRTRLYESIVWAPYANGGCSQDWPPAGSGSLPYPPFPAPGCVGHGTPLDWEMIQRFPVPAEMLAPTPAANLKWRALEAYPSQFSDFLTSFVRKDEFFWLYDYGTNASAIAQVSASSDTPAGLAKNAVDGYVDLDHEWMSQDSVGAWVQLTWPTQMRVAEVDLWDRLDTADNVLAGTLSFSDGSTVAVGALRTDGSPVPVTFTPRAVTWVRFTINQARGSTPGLAEILVKGVPADRAENTSPHFIRGPLPSPAAIDFTQTSTLMVSGHDLDGDALEYAWSADGGTIVGSGPTAVFTPPVVGQNTVFTIGVQVSDGRGGLTSNSAFVTVTAASAQAIALSPTSVPAGLVSSGTVLLSAAAPTGGLVVPLSSSNPSVASVPASVTVAAGRTSATFTVATSSVGAPTPVVITAVFGGQSKSATLTVTPPIPSALALSPASAVGGNTVTGTVTLTAAAPPGGMVLLLSASDPSLVTLPAAVSIAEGAVAGTFAFATIPVISTRTLTISASDGTSTATGSLTLSPLLLSALSLSPSTVLGGSPAAGTVTLNGPAGDAGAIIQLSSNNPSIAGVPPEIAVAPGASTASFAVSTSTVAAAVSATITASFAGASRTAALTVSPAALSSLVLSPTAVTGGAGATGTVTLTGPAAAGGLAVALSSSKPASVSVPASVTVPEGAAAATFPITTTPVTVATTASLTATLGGVSRSATLTVGALSVSTLKLAPASVFGGVASTATVTLSAAAPSPGISLILASSNPAAATVPATILVPGGATSVTFQVASIPVATGTTSSISASYGNTRSATLTVKAGALSTLTLAPTSLVGGTAGSGTVRLTGAAPLAGFAVTLTSSVPAAASVPATVVVPAGAMTADFPITTAPVTTVTSPRITATAGAVTKSLILTVTAKAAAAQVTLAPASVQSRGTAIATVTLNAPASPGGTTVTLRSSSTAVATVPASLVVPEGATAATFNVTAGTVTAVSTSSISTVAGGVTKSATLTVSP